MGARSRVLGSAPIVLAGALLLSAAAPLPAQGRTPEETAKSTAARWKPILGLSDAQTADFEKVALETDRRSAEARAAAGGDAARLKESMRVILADRNAAVAKILTPEQMKKYDAAMALARRKAAEKPAAAPPAKPPDGAR